MPTGACGIDCNTCRLNVQGRCSTCGSGTSLEADGKLAVQRRLLGAPCPILDCARTNRLAYCLRDCDRFPCENFQHGPYPFSQGFLAMQARRRQASDPTPAADENPAAEAFWQSLAAADLDALARRAGAIANPPGRIELPMLEGRWRIDPARRKLDHWRADGWISETDALTRLMILVYLNHAADAGPCGERVGVEDLAGAAFFRGPHVLPTAMLAERFATDPESFERAGRRLGAVPVPLADRAFRLMAFPKVPLYFLLWIRDDEFAARVSILFDRTVERHLPADAIWGTVTLVVRRMLTGQ